MKITERDLESSQSSLMTKIFFTILKVLRSYFVLFIISLIKSKTKHIRDLNSKLLNLKSIYLLVLFCFAINLDNYMILYKTNPDQHCIYFYSLKDFFKRVWKLKRHQIQACLFFFFIFIPESDQKKTWKFKKIKKK